MRLINANTFTVINIFLKSIILYVKKLFHFKFFLCQPYKERTKEKSPLGK